MLGDQSTFGLSGSNGQNAQTFFASRRVSTGGFGQLTVMKSVSALVNNSTASSCDGGGLAATGVQSYSSGLIGSQRLPGGCIGRVQWREMVTH